jgi:hypothetical protein
MIVIVIGRVTHANVAQAILMLARVLRADPEDEPEPCVPHTTPALFTESAACAICLDLHGRIGSVHVPCGHSFHSACIAEWARRARTCPVCRADIAHEAERT